ncbi:hypothetical protein GQ44DRAFT_766978 [Phaeosphaeriaceae sp. PMI808]|nr:hypothetical protein GQ44DRAFT_766978 [Phaeosphaeriaceae sp. PMI808]
MANFRALQPAPLDEEAPPQPQSRPVLTQKPKRTVTLGACVACRKRKSKCDGNRPICTCCTQKDTNCLYELGPNEKPSQAMKRKNEEMQGELSNLRQLYDFLRLRPEQEAMEIFKRIRSNPPDTSPTQRIQDLADFVRHGELPVERPSQSPPLPRLPSYQHDLGKPVTLPPIRLALSNQVPYSFSFSDMLPLCIDGPTAQRRRHVSEIDVSARLDSQSLLPPRTSIESILYSPSGVVADEPLPDPRLASAKNWTTVTSNVGLIVSLLSSWTLIEHSYYHYLDREAFLDDMSSGRTDFCSELLVNALLASACSNSPAVKDRNKPLPDGSIMTAFYKEAIRLWKLEDGISSLTNIHAALCLYLVLGKIGRDNAGHLFLVDACRMSQELGLFRSKTWQSSSPKPLHVPQEKWNTMEAATAWAVFNFQLNMSLIYSFPVIIKTIPYFSIPYQSSPDSEALFRSECAKYTIMLDGATIILRTNVDSEQPQLPLDIEEIKACVSRLRSWWQARPPNLHPDKVPSKQNLLCAMMYHVNIINLFQPFFSANTSTTLPTPSSDHARLETSASLKEIRWLLALHEVRHGWTDAIGLVLHPLSVTSFGSLDEIAQAYPKATDAERSEPYQGLLVCLRALGALSRYNFYAQPLFRLLTQKCQGMELHMPTELQIIMNDYTSDEWTRRATSLISSQYIADIRKTISHVSSARMDAIISDWDTLSLDDRGERRPDYDSEVVIRSDQFSSL